jgi:hypothetical protein
MHDEVTPPSSVTSAHADPASQPALEIGSQLPNDCPHVGLGPVSTVSPSACASDAAVS